jgi:hypothetical protein
MNLLRSALLASSLGLTVGALGACYPVYAQAYDCYYYYGQYYPYCDYGYYDAYSTSDSYSTMRYSEVEAEQTPNPDPNLAPTSPDSTVNVSTYSYLAHNGGTGDEPDLGSFDDRYACNQINDDVLTLCTSDDQPFDADAEYIVIAFELENPLPKDDAVNFFVVMFAFDSDNDATNNYVPPAELANDYAGATDKWIAASYSPADGWQLQAFEWDGTAVSGVETNARVILEAGSAALVIPNSEFEVTVPGNRIALFRHTGDQGANGDWSGLVYPPLGTPLAGP